MPREIREVGASSIGCGQRRRGAILSSPTELSREDAGMSDRLKGKLAFCTASGAGIGRATAMAFAREGARVVASDLNEAAMAGLKEAGVTECVKLDARDAGAIEAL